MNNIVYLETSKKIRYWFNELPPLQLTNDEKHIFNIIKNTNYEPNNKEINFCIELFLPRNASNYGLLGFEYKYSKENLLNIEIGYVLENEIYYKSELLPKSLNEYTYSGINIDYLNAIIKSINENIYNYDIKGNLKINLGANCEIGSSNKIFYYITQNLLCILKNLIDKEEISKEIIEEVITKSFNSL